MSERILPIVLSEYDIDDIRPKHKHTKNTTNISHNKKQKHGHFFKKFLVQPKPPSKCQLSDPDDSSSVDGLAHAIEPQMWEQKGVEVGGRGTRYQSRVDPNRGRAGNV